MEEIWQIIEKYGNTRYNMGDGDDNRLPIYEKGVNERRKTGGSVVKATIVPLSGKADSLLLGTIICDLLICIHQRLHTTGFLLIRKKLSDNRDCP